MSTAHSRSQVTPFPSLTRACGYVCYFPDYTFLSPFPLAAAAAHVPGGEHFFRCHNTSKHPLSPERHCCSSNYALRWVHFIETDPDLRVPIPIDFDTYRVHADACQHKVAAEQYAAMTVQEQLVTWETYMQTNIPLSNTGCACSVWVRPSDGGLSFFDSQDAQQVRVWFNEAARKKNKKAHVHAYRRPKLDTVHDASASLHLTLKDDTANVPNHHMLDVVEALPFDDLQTLLVKISSDFELKASGEESDDPPAPASYMAALVRPKSQVMQLWVAAMRWYFATVCQQDPVLAPDEDMAARLFGVAATAQNMRVAALSVRERCLLARVAYTYSRVLPELAEDHIKDIFRTHSTSSNMTEQLEDLAEDIRSEWLERRTTLHIVAAQVLPSVRELLEHKVPFIQGDFLCVPHLCAIFPLQTGQNPAPFEQSHVATPALAIEPTLPCLEPGQDVPSGHAACAAAAADPATAAPIAGLLDRESSDQLAEIDFMDDWEPERTAQPSPSNSSSALSTPAEGQPGLSACFSRATTVSGSSSSTAVSSAFDPSASSSGFNSRPAGQIQSMERERSEIWKYKTLVNRKLKSLEGRREASSPRASTASPSLEPWRCATRIPTDANEELMELAERLQQHVSDHAYAKACPLINTNVAGHLTPSGFGIQRLEYDNRLAIKLPSLSWDAAAVFQDSSDSVAIDAAVKRDAQLQDVIVQAIIKKSTQSGSYAVLVFSASLRFILIHSLWVTVKGGPGVTLLNRDVYRDKGKNVATAALTQAWNAGMVHCAAEATLSKQGEWRSRK